MNISFTGLKRFFKRTKQKDVGISLVRTRRNWHAMLVGGVCVILVGGGAASYEFLTVRNADSAVTIDPVETTRYRAADIEKALLRYDARKKEFEAGKSIPTVVPVAAEEKVDMPPPVASTTDLKVE